MRDKYYCPLAGEHINDPCPCGWSSKQDKEYLAKDIMEQLPKYLDEVKDPEKQYDILDFVNWLIAKSK
jgi:hypothetical protein